jgi:hypothetical protein
MTKSSGDDSVVTLKLCAPIPHPDGEINELRIRKPKAKDLRAMDNGHPGEIAKTFSLAQQLTGVSMPYLELMDAGDFIAMSTIVQGFLRPSPATGA